MDAEPFLLVKFLRKPEYAEELLDGRIYCNTPEFYRTNSAPGVGDPYESAVIYVRDPEQAADFEIQINDQAVDGLVGFIMRTEPDQYLHCWMAFKKPDDAAGFNQLAQDIKQLRGEFGQDYVMLLPKHIAEYAKRLSEAVGNEIECGHMAYSDDPLEQSPRCKRTRYAYQREFRFLLGLCGDGNAEARTFTYAHGFRDIMLHNAEIKLKNKTTGEDFLRLAGRDAFEARHAKTD